MIIGLAGKSCSGKNQIAEMLEFRGFLCIDLDLEVHRLQESMKEILLTNFGDSILDSHGQIDRRALGQIVFKSPPLLKKLEDLLYPKLDESLNRIICDARPGAHIILNAAALQKGEFWKRCDLVIWVSAPWGLRFLRALKRDQRSLLHICRRFRAQKELKSQFFLSRVDTYIIRNGFTRSVLQKRVDSLIKHLPPER
ncbi:dephospho-CoA kinase [Oceanispirochaeta crateris]|uniref:Dephospho-CoA kinase n=1 Tax=Oceanispirochaeta crateris TaxID=2518645 RepID=A0A5C1QHX7_9SPIO|nr:dephospho-CoA kinase [Oceanispirochaeta crateris]QEN07127.1 dephospho-CoA kinase [Oceanispirochaeta crateris]